MAHENKHIEQVDSIRSKRREEFALKKLSEWKYGIKSSLTAKDLLLAADALLKEANSIYPPLSLVTGSSPDIYLELAFAGSKDKDNTEQERKKIKPSNELDKMRAVSNKNYDQEARDLESIKAFNNKSIDGQQKKEIDDFNRYILHGTKFISSYVRPVFNRVIEAIDDNKLSKFAAPRRGSFVDFLENPKTFSLYIEALRKEYKRKQDYLEVINNREGVYQKLLSLRHAENNQDDLYQKFLSRIGVESSVSPETLKQKLDMLQAKKEQITADSEKLGKLKDLIDVAEILIKKRQAWQLTKSDESYVRSERSKEQNENVRKKVEAMSSMPLGDAISRQDIDENLRLAIVNDKLADDIDSPDPEELTEALDLAVKHDRKNIYLRLLKEGASHSEKYLKNLKYLKDLIRVKTTPLSPEAGVFSNQPQSPLQPAGQSFSDPHDEPVNEFDSGRLETPEPSLSRPASPSLSDSDRESVISRSETPEPSLLRPASSSLSDSDRESVISRSVTPDSSRSVKPVKRKSKRRIVTIADPTSTPKALSEVGEGNPSLGGTLVDAQSQSLKTAESRGGSKVLPEVDKGKPSFGSVVWTWITAPFRALWKFVTAPFRKEKNSPAVVAAKSADEASDKATLVNTQSQDAPLTQMSVEKSLDEGLPKTVVKPADQASDNGVLANAQPQPPETPEPRGESKALPEVRKGNSSFGSVVRVITKVTKALVKKSQDNELPKAANQASDGEALGNTPPKNVPSSEVSGEEQEINASLALIPEEERTRMLGYDTIGKEYFHELGQVEKTEKQQRVLEEKATTVRLLAETWQEQAKAQDKQAARSLRSPMSQSGFNLERSITVPAQTIQPVREIRPTAENKQQTVSLSSTPSSMHLNTTRQEIQSVMKIDAKASAEEVMQFFLDHAMRIYLGHPKPYLAYRDNKDAETFVNEFIPDARKLQRGNAFKELFKTSIALGSFNAIPGFDKYLEGFSTYMQVFAEEIRAKKVVVTILHDKEKRHKYREYKLAAVLAFLIGKRLLEKEHGSNNIPPEKLGQLMLAMAQHFYENHELYKGGKGLGSYYPYMDLMAKKALELMPKPAKTEDVVENTSEKTRGALSNRGGL